MELEVYKQNGEKTTRKVKLSDEVFGATPNDHAIYLDVKQYMANQRQGTSSSRERSAVRGSSRKIKKQKGTGSARFGDVKNPIFRGGGRVFGPQPRDYWFKLNKKVKKLARKSALSYKALDKDIIILEDFSFEVPKTQKFVELLNSFELQDKKTLLVIKGADNNIYLSSRNIQKTKVSIASTINTYDILNANKLLIHESSIEEIEKMFTK
ncbi:MAG: 50S ribosomal protein L4 [Saprospiraceae bacterium]|nr:50S ribosomal protein L4 [Saprospiraceae bacterium]